MKPIIRSGYDFAHLVEISLDGAPEVLTGRTIKACLKSLDKASELIADVTLSSSATGADYANGIVLVEFPAASTVNLTTPQDAWIELAVINGSLRYPVRDVAVLIEKGWALS